MNSFYKAVDFLKDRFENNNNVNTVLFGRTEEKDLYKKNIYPVVHINPVAAPITTSAVSLFQFEIAALDQRDISNGIQRDKFEGNDNLQDNLNITYHILLDLVNSLKTQYNEYGVELEATTDMTPLLFTDHNILDGWVITITLKLENTISC